MHAPTENDLILFGGLRRQTLRGFFDKLKRGCRTDSLAFCGKGKKLIFEFHDHGTIDQLNGTVVRIAGHGLHFGKVSIVPRVCLRRRKAAAKIQKFLPGIADAEGGTVVAQGGDGQLCKTGDLMIRFLLKK